MCVQHGQSVTKCDKTFRFKVRIKKSFPDMKNVDVVAIMPMHNVKDAIANRPLNKTSFASKELHATTLTTTMSLEQPYPTVL